MDQLIKRLRTDWEKTLFWTMLLVLFGTLGFWLLHDNEGASEGGGNKMRNRASFLGQTPYAFLDGEPADRIPTNPFSFGFKPVQKRPWRRPTGTGTTKRPTRPTRTPRKPGTTAKPATTPAAPSAPAKPEVPPPARILTYRGYLEGTTHKMVAFVKVADPATKKSSMVQLSVGRKIDGIEIKKFTGEMLQVIDPMGKPLQIAKGGRKKIVLE